jgi:hypothetical protein
VWHLAGVQRYVFEVSLILVLALTASCGGTQKKSHVATDGIVLGITRDIDSGDPIALATILIRRQGETFNQATKSSDRGLYQFYKLGPGRYNAMASFAGQTITVNDVVVVAGEAVAVDFPFSLANPSHLTLSYGNGLDSAIFRFHPKNTTQQTARIEGTLSDNNSRGRVIGAAISLIPDDGAANLQQTVTDEYGQFSFDDVRPGTYSLSSYYALQGRGQVELRRSGITVAAGEGVRVPLWVEVSK